MEHERQDRLLNIAFEIRWHISRYGGASIADIAGLIGCSWRNAEKFCSEHRTNLQFERGMVIKADEGWEWRQTWLPGDDDNVIVDEGS